MPKILKILSLFILTQSIQSQQYTAISNYRNQVPCKNFLQIAIQTRELQTLILEYIDFWDIVQTLHCDGIINAIAYAPAYIICGSDNNLIIWQLHNSLFTLLCTVKEAHVLPVQTIAISPDSKCIASGCSKEIKIWRLEKNNLKNIQTLSTPHTIEVIKFSKNGTYIVGAMKNTYIIWKLDAFRCTEIQNVKIGNCALATDTEISDMMQLVSVSENKVKILVFIHNQFLLTQILNQDGIRAIACSPERTYIAAGSKEGAIYVWNRENNTYTFKQKLFAHDESITSVIFSRDEEYLISLSDHSICIWQNINNQWECKFRLKKENIMHALAFCRMGASFVNTENNVINIWRNSRQDLEMAHTQQRADMLVTIVDEHKKDHGCIIA